MYCMHHNIDHQFEIQNKLFSKILRTLICVIINLYEATYFRVQGQVILDDAHVFTKTHLENIAKDPLRCNSTFSKHVQDALERRIRKRLQRLGAILWWKGFDVPKNLPYMRDRMVENYFWVLGVYFEPQYARSRTFLGKVCAMATIMDDTYDAYGTYEELKIFTEAVQKWSATCLDCLDSLPDYMKPIYKGLLDVYEKMEEILAKEGRAYEINYSKDSMKELNKSYMMEAKWRHDGYVPTVEEHKSVSFMTCGYKMLATSSFVGMSMTTDEAFKWIKTYPPLVKASCVICRLMDDLVGYKEDKQRKHVASTVDSYLKQNDDTKEEKVFDLLNQEVEDAWKEINRESLVCKDIPLQLIMNVINLARVIDTLYKHDDNFTRVGEEFKDKIKACFVHAMSL
ncbi:putative germacrene-A synthase [Helianthus debilis subsp. tardiflorus]